MWINYVNWLIDQISKIMDGEINEYLRQDETTVLDIIIYTIAYLIYAIIFGWWLIPLRYILTQHKFR